jgi:hypothetical protein
MNLTPDTSALVGAALRKALAPHLPEGLIGISCIAVGADSLFAEAVLDVGGELEVILPAADYRERKVQPDHAQQFDSLISRASHIRTMPYDVSNRAAYEAAGEALLSASDILFAVWDGGSAVDAGSTGAVVDSARSRGTRVKVIWPDGASRG